MSERKTTEIKFRTSPTWKARVQSAAAEADESLSEFIEKAVEERLWAAQNQRIDGTALIDNAIAALRPGPVESLLDADDLAVIAASDTEDEPMIITAGTSAANGVVKIGDIVRHIPTGNVVTVTPIAPTEDVPTSGDESRVVLDETAKAMHPYKPRPWMFEARGDA